MTESPNFQTAPVCSACNDAPSCGMESWDQLHIELILDILTEKMKQSIDNNSFDYVASLAPIADRLHCAIYSSASRGVDSRD